MKFWYDTEFLEDGPEVPVRLISIGVVAEDGREFYAVNSGMPVERIKDPSCKSHIFLTQHVIPSLPIIGKPTEDWQLDLSNESVMTRSQIAKSLKKFLRGDDTLDLPILWGYFPAYDHLMYAQQLFGRMMDLPFGFPMTTFDVVQLDAHLRERGIIDGTYQRPEMAEGNKHNALADAYWHKAMYDSLIAAENKWAEKISFLAQQQHRGTPK